MSKCRLEENNWAVNSSTWAKRDAKRIREEGTCLIILGHIKVISLVKRRHKKSS